MFFSLLQRAAVLASSVCCYRNKSILNSFIFTSFCEIGFISFPWLSHTPERALWDSDSAISGSVRTSYPASMIKGNGPHPYSKASSSFQEDTSPWNDCHSQSITEMQLYPWSRKEQRSGWHSLEYHGHAGKAPQSTHQKAHPPSAQSTHQMSSARQKDHLHRVPTKSCTQAEFSSG